MIDATKLRAIVCNTQDDFRSLAAAAGGNPTTFYRGANFNDTDLRGEDLRGFNLEAATFKRTRIDRNTLVDENFSTIAGTKRVMTVRMPLGNLLQGVLSSVGIKILRPTLKQYGDLIEESIFSEFSKSYISNNNVFLMPFDKDAFLILVNRNLSKEISKQYYRSEPIKTSVKNTLMISSNSFIFSHFQTYLFGEISDEKQVETIRQAALTQRTAEAALIISRKAEMGVQELCCILLIAYASALRMRP